MGAMLKILIGAILVIAAVSYVYTNQYGAWSDFLTVVNGTVPAFVGLIGLFVIWLELDEIKISRSLKEAEKKK